MPSALRPSPHALTMATLSLAVHAALLASWHHRPQAVTLGAAAAPSVLQVSLLAATHSAASGPRPNRFDATPPGAQTDPVADPAASAALQTMQPMRSMQPTQQAVPQTRALPIQPENPPGPLTAASEWAYLPAGQLDQRPRPEAAIPLPFPEGETLARGTRVSAVLVLYVGEEGTIDRIEFGQSALPPAFARVALESFARVRMRPGIKNGRARRAMMKIEVEFEAPVSKQAAGGLVLESSRSWQSSPQEKSLQCGLSDAGRGRVPLRPGDPATLPCAPVSAGSG